VKEEVDAQLSEKKPGTFDAVSQNSTIFVLDSCSIFPATFSNMSSQIGGRFDAHDLLFSGTWLRRVTPRGMQLSS
jgi:hypothetical protein